MKTNYTPNMDFYIEGDNLILRLSVDAQDVDGTLKAFQKLTFKGAPFEKYVERGGVRTPFLEFMAAHEEARATPEGRKIAALEKRVTAAEFVINKIVERITALEKRPRAPRVPSGRNNLPAVNNWHAKVAAGDEKFLKMNAIVEATGLKIIVIHPGKSYENSEPHEIRAAGTVEVLYDTQGEERLRVILTVMSQLLEVSGRITDTILMALKHALYTAQKPLHQDEVFSRAVDIFSIPWPKLTKHLDELKEGYGFPRQTILGMLITGEMKLPKE